VRKLRSKKWNKEELELAQKEEEEREKKFPWFHDMEKDQRDEMWFHCLHCSQCFLGKEALPYMDDGEILFTCPVPGCDGNPIDWHSWESLKFDFKDIDFTEVPARGVKYDLNEMGRHRMTQDPRFS
jgi:hypothetical protein